jgi:hypothetical protein
MAEISTWALVPWNAKAEMPATGAMLLEPLTGKGAGCLLAQAAPPGTDAVKEVLALMPAGAADSRALAT